MADSRSGRITLDEGESVRRVLSRSISATSEHRSPARLALIVVLTFAATAVFMVLAGASHRDLSDGNDTRGRLDVRKVKSFGAVKKPGWRVITRARWNVRWVQDRGFALINLDTFGDSRFDYYALIGSNGSRMKGTLWRDRSSRRDRMVSKLAVWRADRKSVSVRVPLSKMKRGNKRLEYRWYVQTLYTSSKCKQVCIDRVPNRGAISDPNGRTPPTPTVSPTETP
jgi:hypothetical protein